MAEGASLSQACKALGVEERTAYRWMIAQPEFCQDVYRARELRGDLAFGEQILEIADDTENDYKTAINGRKVPDKELMLRSKIRIEARQFHMRQLHPQTWGERQQIDLKNDMTQLTVEERLRKAAELLDLVRAITGPRPVPPPLEYHPEEPEDDSVEVGRMRQSR